MDPAALARARAHIPRDGLGLGLRPPLYGALDESTAGVDFFEVISDNFLEPTGLARENLSHFAAKLPVVAHGVGLNLLGADPLDLEYLTQLRAFLRDFELPYTTDHLCWTAHRGVQHHDLLPAPLSSGLVGYAIERAAFVQEFLGVPFGIENLSSYVAFSQSDLTEWEFLRQVVVGADVFLLLDINNIFVSSRNHGFSPEAYLEAIPWERVLHVHVAGHRVTPTGLLHDTHDRPLAPEVWDLYRRAWKLGGPFPTLLEWDADIPPLAELVEVLDKARRLRDD